MREKDEIRFESYIKKRRGWKLWQKVVGSLMCVVVFCTTYALILPAITQETETFCGQEEHIHEAGCYQTAETAAPELICQLEEAAAHVHEEACYLPAHTHGEECYVPEQILVCEAAEAEAHVHGTECYSMETPLICGQEASEGHTHGESCYAEAVTSLTCGLTETEEHTHTDACYTTTGGGLTCTLEESEGHTHTDTCNGEAVETLICTLEETEGHTHTETCYTDGEPILVCELEERAEAELICTAAETEGHTHTESCYASSATETAEGVLVCELEEHTHDLTCHSNPNADIENASDWEQTFADVELTGVWADDLLAIAETQMGYQESTKNYIVLEDGETTKGYTRYGAWYGDPYGDWCAMFVSFCLHYAEVPEEAIPQHYNCNLWIETLSGEEWNLYTPAEGYTPVPGDLIFFDQDGDGVSDHVGLVKELTDEGLTTIEGNSGNRVKSNTYAPDDSTILGYSMMPEPEVEAEPTPTTQTAAIYTDGTYETLSDDTTVITVTGIIPEDAEIKAFPVTVESELNVLCAYDISIILSDGTVFEPAEGETLDVSIQSSSLNETEDELKVYYIPEEGEPEPVNTTITDEGVEFDADHFSTYAVAAVDTSDIQISLSSSKDVTHEAYETWYSEYPVLGSYKFGYALGWDQTEITVSITCDAFSSTSGHKIYKISDNSGWNSVELVETTLSGTTMTFTTTPNINQQYHYVLAATGSEAPISGDAATADEFFALMKGSKTSVTIRLTGDITLSNPMETTAEVNIDLNGHTITCENSNALFVINTGGSLTLTDSQATAETVEKTSLDPLGAHEASVSSSDSGVTLTYYVTESEVNNSSTGATTETVYKHTVTASGAIKAGSGPVFQVNGGTLNIESGMICGGTGQAITGNSMVNLSGGYICGFTSTGTGGAVSMNGGTLNISEEAVIAANHANTFGGGVALQGSTLNMTGGYISGNTVSTTSYSTGTSATGLGDVRGGAGIYSSGSTVNLSSGYVTNNNCLATGYWGGGGGILFQGGSTLNLSGGYVTGNEANAGGGIKGGDWSGVNSMYMTGGYVCSNLATYGEGGGIAFGIGSTDGSDPSNTGHITAGYINNNYADCKIDWGGGGLFIANGSYMYVTSALISDNSAGGFGGGVAGCSTARMHISVTEGAGIHANRASGTNTSGAGSTKNEDWIYAKNSEVFMENGYQDIFSALNCTVEGGMLGGGVANWSGSCDGAPVTSNRAEDLIQSQYVLGLTARPSDYAVSQAQAVAAVYINGNYAYTHGGGILCNGYLVMGTPREFVIGARIELTAEKTYLDADGAEQTMTDGQFTFHITEIADDGTETLVSTGTNNTAGVITFDGRLPFSDDGVYTYHIYEVAGKDSSIVYDSALYRMTVTVERTATTNPNGLSNVTTYQCRVENVLVEKRNDETGKWETYIESFNPNDSDNSAIKLDLGSDTFVNRPRDGGMDMTVSKIWADPEDTLESVEVRLMQNGTAYGETVTLSDENEWTYTWTDLPDSDKDGNTYSYQIEEVVPDGFAASYSYSSDGSVTTITNTRKTYQLDITKISDDETPVTLAGAVFQLLDSGENALSFVKAEDTGIYTLSDAAAESATTELVTGADGKLVLAGLPAGTYALDETAAPAGYALAASIEVTLSDDTDGMDENGILSMTVVDKAVTYTLPETGGTSTILYTTAGLLMMFSSSVLLSKNNRKREGDSAD